jgi:hypothetical protein
MWATTAAPQEWHGKGMFVFGKGRIERMLYKIKTLKTGRAKVVSY